MKKIALLAVFGFSLLAGFQSQAKVNINIQFGAPVAQQSWYANDNDYYYMPDQGVYYNVRRQVYVFPESGRWVFAKRLPSRYGNVGYNNVRYVRVRDRMPFDRDNDYRRRYVASNNNGFGGRNTDPHSINRPGNQNGWDRNDNDRGGNWNSGTGNNNGYNGRGDDRGYGNGSNGGGNNTNGGGRGNWGGR